MIGGRQIGITVNQSRRISRTPDGPQFSQPRVLTKEKSSNQDCSSTSTDSLFEAFGRDLRGRFHLIGSNLLHISHITAYV